MHKTEEVVKGFHAVGNEHRKLLNSQHPPTKYPTVAIPAILGAILSLIVTGFSFGTNNNLFHLPIVASLFDEPQFRNDEFIQSLRFFAAGPWLAMRGSASWIDPKILFGLLHVLSRILLFFGFLLSATTLGVTERRQQLLLVALLSVSFVLRGASLGGFGGLLIPEFTHSEFGNGLFLIALYLVVTRRIAAALGVAGLAAWVNAFVGVWVLFTLSIVFLYQFSKAEYPLRSAIREVAIGAIAATAIALPVAANILSNPDALSRHDFDYVNYLSEYYPYHFLFSAYRPAEKIMLGAILVLGLSSFNLLKFRGHPWSVALMASAAIYTVGIVAPIFTHAPIVLNLHLLRSSTQIHLLAALAAGSLVCKSWFDGARPAFRLGAPLIALGVINPVTGPLYNPAIIVLTGSLVLVSGLCLAPRNAVIDIRRLTFLGPWLRAGTLGVLAASVAALAWENYSNEASTRAWIKNWRAVGIWARMATPASSIFLIPIAEQHRIGPARDIDMLTKTNAIFEYESHRQLWVDFKRGGAVMWWPHYYQQWHDRVTEVSGRMDLNSRLAYAKNNGIRYVIDICDPARPLPEFSRGKVCVYSADNDGAPDSLK